MKSKTLILILMHFITYVGLQVGDVDASPVVNSVKVRSSWKTLADSAVVKLPKELYLEGLTPFSEGDRVTVEMGYLDGQGAEFKRTVFNGFVAMINPRVPLELHCEDATWLARRTPIMKNWPGKVKLSEVAKYSIDQINTANPDYSVTLNNDIPEIEFSSYRIANANAAQVFEDLKKYGLAVYFDDLNLNIRLAYLTENLKSLEPIKYNLQEYGDSHNLQYVSESSNNVTLNAIGILPDGTTIKKRIGDGNGFVIDRTYPNITDESTLETVARNELSKFKFEGYKGSLKTFFLPFATHSMTAEVTDPELDRVSSHVIDAVTYTLDIGIETEVELGIKVS